MINLSFFRRLSSLASASRSDYQSLFRIRRDEWLPAIAMLLLFVGLQILMVQYDYTRFTCGGHNAFYSRFHGQVEISGFDDFTLITVSDWRILYQLMRHPLLAAFWWPVAEANYWSLEWFDFNAAVFLIAAVMLLFDFYSFIFLLRILRFVVGLPRIDAVLVACLFFMFAYIMLSMFVPDHFGLSLTLLLLALYMAGLEMKQKRRFHAAGWGLLYLLTAGVTLTNGVKTLLACLFAKGRRMFRLRSLLLVAIVPTVLLGAAYYLQHEFIVKPDMAHGQQIAKRRMKKDANFAKRIAEHDRQIAENKKHQLSDNPLFEWTDAEASRWQTVKENLFGESIQLHRDYLLQDVNKQRPVFVVYGHLFNYVVEGLLVTLFLLGCLAGCRKKFFQLCLSWFVFDMLIHLVLGFGIIEVYIMAAHWLFIVPIAIGYLMKKTSGSLLTAIRLAVLFLTLYLLVYNGTLIYQYMTHSVA